MNWRKLRRLKEKYAIVGVGYTPQGNLPGRSALSFCVEACANAIKDAGLSKEDIDGLLCYRRFAPLKGEAEVTAFLVAQHLGIAPTVLSQEANCARNHMVQAVSLLEAGFCSYVLLVYGDNALSGGRTFLEETTHSEPAAENIAHGMLGPLGGYAMAARRGMHVFGTGPETWREIAASQRRWANLNPDAMMYEKELTEEMYMSSPFLVEPFRRHDACLVGDGGRACIITSVERARNLKQPVAAIMGIGEANPSTDINQSTFMAGETGAKKAGEMAFRMAGIDRADVDAFQIYDCFTYTVEITLQDYGYFSPGGGREWFAHGRTSPGGEVPVNTSGGMLSEGYCMGLTPLTEAAMQIMGRCGQRQLGPRTNTKVPEIILCSDNGAVLQSHCSVILRRL